eukprot:gene12874-8752_t
MPEGFKKHQHGSSGPYTDAYHQLLGRTPWIFVKRLLPAASRPTAGASLVLPRSPMPAAPPHLSEGDIATVFSQFGEVEDVRFVRHGKTGRFLGTAFVRFRDYRSGIAAANDMNSNFETGELCVLYLASPTRGIVVERCQEVEIPPPPAGSPTYADWLEGNKLVHPMLAALPLFRSFKTMEVAGVSGDSVCVRISLLCSSPEGPTPRQARRYLPIPPKPTSVPLGVNPLATSDRGQTRKPRHDDAIPVQLPPPVRLFVSYYGMGCVAQLPAAPAAQPLAVLGKAGWSVRSPTLSLSPSPPQGAGGALHPAVAQAVQDSRDTLGPSHLFERYAERGAALLCQGDDWAAQAVLAVPGRPAAAACGEDRTYLVTLDGALYGSVAPRDGSLPRMEHMVLGGQLVTAIAAGGRTGLAITREQY